ncbi:hypothetical protein GF359_09705 [candidate division WOR-3 bacterium]|uniref:Uncharacterized protein n=1 Tax=candidate division WOR-3 bacterium TaxID=2052148 RepID=A0A9D5QDC4_UNCW3|nr:hypothetical protein [candidate division WOR-3 bacterium]MBD3365474.1 hypothetical protein [candidate division WOR-3 bacterium]
MCLDKWVALHTQDADGTWSGTAYVVSDDDSFDIDGTAEGTFTYGSVLWTWSGEGIVTDSDPEGITGGGSGSGDIECTSNSAPCGSCQ